MIIVAVTIGYLVTFAVFIAAVAFALVNEQRDNRKAMRDLEEEFKEIGSWLDDERRGSR